MAKTVDPMAEMLKQIKDEVRAKKDSEFASKALAEQLDAGRGKTDALKDSMNAAKGMGGAFGKVLGTLASVGKVAAIGLGPVSALIGGITQGLLAPIDAIKEMADAIIQLVALANPGAVQQFTLALNDAMAVIGAAMTPMLEGMTIATRGFGDALAQLMPVMQPLFDAIGQLLANWAVAASGVYQAMAPLIELLVDDLVEVLHDVTLGVATFQGALIELWTTLFSLLGMKSDRFKGDNNSQGAALRNFKSSSVDQFSKDLFAKQLSVQGKGGQGKTPEQNMDDIRKAVEQGQKFIRNISEVITSIWEWIKSGPVATLIRKLSGETGVSAVDVNPMTAIGAILGKAFLK